MEENESTVNSLRCELETVKEKHGSEVEKLSNMNEKISNDNSQLVEKGKEATESLKVALQQLTEEKKAMQEQNNSGPGKSTLDLETSLERAKKEREIFRQRCEKSEILQRNLQQEITLLEKELKEKEEHIKSLLQKNEASSNGKQEVVEGSNSVEDNLSTEKEMKSAQSRVLQLKNYVHVLEDRVKEKEDNILSLRNENALANDLVMEKSLELSRTRRILERKIDKLAKENSEWKRKFLIPNSSTRSSEQNEQFDVVNVQARNTLEQRRQPYEGDIEKQTRGLTMENKDRRKSNPERSAIQATLRRHGNIGSHGTVQHPLSNNNLTKTEEITNSNLSVDRSLTKGEQISELTSVDRSLTKGEQSSELTSVDVLAVDVAPRRRMGGKFIRASSNRHSADLGRLMSRPESAAARKSDR